jgi:hypothetical protein
LGIARRRVNRRLGWTTSASIERRIPDEEPERELAPVPELLAV